MAAKYLSGILSVLGAPGKASLFAKGQENVSLFSDSMGVVAVAANPVTHAATKHLEIADFYVRELVERSIVGGVRTYSLHARRCPYQATRS